MEQINYFEASKHKIYQAYQVGGEIKRSFTVGEAHRDKSRGFFVLKLNAFPNVKYFLVKNYRNDDKYTLFTVIRKTEDGYSFFRPIGKAELLEGRNVEDQAYLKITIPLLGMKIYMDVSNNTIDEAEEYYDLNLTSEEKQIA